jgi:hypothetical protein
MTSTYYQEPTTYAWSESDRQYGRPYMAPQSSEAGQQAVMPSERAEFTDL